MAQAQQAGQPNRRQPKIPGKNKFAHVPDTQFGMGDNYGSGIKAKVGRVVDGYDSVVSKAGLRKPPKSLA